MQNYLILYKSHTSNLLRELKIVDVETLIDIKKFTIIKLLHRDKLSKDILLEDINAKNEDRWLYKDIKKICEQIGLEIERVCYYPGIKRKRILEKYYEANHIEKEIREEMHQLLKDRLFV